MPDLTGRQRMVIDYMRGNGSELMGSGRAHLIHRGSFRSARSVSLVLTALESKGLLTRPEEPFFCDGDPLLANLTAAGKRSG